MADYADFWTDPSAAGRAGVVRHAPDADQYHVPDPNQLAKMPVGKVGRFAVVPAAGPDGEPLGFDPTVAGPVHVDPAAPDGGVIFDPRAVRDRDIAAAVAASKYPHQVFYQLGVPPRGAPPPPGPRLPPPAANPRLPGGTYLTPTATPSHPLEDYAVTPPAPVPAPPAFGQPQHAPAAAPPPIVFQPPQPYAPPPLDPNVQALAGMVSTLYQVVAGQVPARPTTPTTGISPNPMPVGRPPATATTPAEARRPAAADGDFEPRPIPRKAARPPEPEPHDTPQTLREFEAAGAEPDALIIGFESLNLRFVTGPLPHKPKRQVVFHIPNAGTYMTRFHDVIVASECVALVYDTRYEEGQQYSPPDLGETVVRIEVPHLKKTFAVTSMGFAFQLGVFDVIVLVKNENAAVDYGHDE